MSENTRMPPARWAALGNTDLAHKVLETPLCDTHEHLRRHHDFQLDQVDVLSALFDNYVTSDLVVAGASPESVDHLINPQAGPVSERFRAVEAAWNRCRYTGYGEAVQMAAEHFYDLMELTPESLEAAADDHARLMATRSRRRILQEDAHLDHVQIDDFTMEIVPDDEDRHFFLYDISLMELVSGTPDPEALHRLTGVSVTNLNDLQRAMEQLFALYGREAVACKTQHAYQRTLAWERRERSDAAVALDRWLLQPEAVSAQDRLVLGDWCLDLGAHLAREHALPIKIHTGYYAGHSRMPLDFISCRHLCGLLAAHLDTDFVLMHNSYPYAPELAALAKHYPNVYIDMCWAWSINPFDAMTMLRHAIHSVPINRIFAFGADTHWPTAAYAYAMQARWWLTHTLEREIADGYLNEAAARDIAERVMSQNQYDCFPRLHRTQ